MEEPKKIVKEHESIREFTEVIEVPEHEKRKGESKLFHENVKRLKQDDNYKCFICGSTEDLQTHHVLAEWSLQNSISYDKLTKLSKIIDVYGYGNSDEFKDKPIESVDDIRNMMVLCRKHHEERITGIHNTTASAFLSQYLTKDGEEIIPQDHNKSEEKIKK